eukprot:GHVU01133243.1.p2 GENE.GHVU01133243.1~~GHVU01133243.1.p2  ORF type:complete len:108 (-),score=14.64 GHVU01133243.1:1974-2297(-)
MSLDRASLPAPPPPPWSLIHPPFILDAKTQNTNQDEVRSQRSKKVPPSSKPPPPFPPPPPPPSSPAAAIIMSTERGCPSRSSPGRILYPRSGPPSPRGGSRKGESSR